MTALVSGWFPDVPTQSAVTTGVRIQRLRLALGLTQIDVAQSLGHERNTLVSRIESGRTDADDETLSAIARRLGCSTAFLSGVRDEVAPPTRPWLRANADAPKRSVDAQLADCETVFDAVRILELPRYPDNVPIFTGDLEDDQQIEAFALEVRAEAGLGESDVVGNSIRAAERLGCIVLPMNGELGRHVGMSTRVDMIPVICVARAGSGEAAVPGDRQRFTVAHELGHLCLHAELEPPRTSLEARAIENQAHRFAAAFLAPGDAVVESVREQQDRVTLRTLQALKSEWGMSARAFVTRLKHLDIIEEPKATSLFKQISARGWNKAEPGNVPNEYALWMSRALDHVSNGASDPVDEAAARTGLDRLHFDRWLEWVDVGTGGQVTEILTRSVSASGQAKVTGSATITRLSDRPRRG